jgi:proteasome lid subunit RPN8/RPN11
MSLQGSLVTAGLDPLDLLRDFDIGRMGPDDAVRTIGAATKTHLDLVSPGWQRVARDWFAFAAGKSGRLTKEHLRHVRNALERSGAGQLVIDNQLNLLKGTRRAGVIGTGLVRSEPVVGGPSGTDPLREAMARVRATNPRMAPEDLVTVKFWLQAKSKRPQGLQDFHVDRAIRLARSRRGILDLRADNIDALRASGKGSGVTGTGLRLTVDAMAAGSTLDQRPYDPRVDASQNGRGINELEYQRQRIRHLASPKVSRDVIDLLDRYLHYTGGARRNVQEWAATKAGYAARTLDPKAIADIRWAVGRFEQAERAKLWTAADPDAFAPLGFQEEDLMNAITRQGRVPVISDGVKTGGSITVARALEEIRKLGYMPEFLKRFRADSAKERGHRGPVLSAGMERGPRYTVQGPIRFKTNSEDVKYAARAEATRLAMERPRPYEYQNPIETLETLGSVPAMFLHGSISALIDVGQTGLTKALGYGAALDDPDYRKYLGQWKEASTQVAVGALMTATQFSQAASMLLMLPTKMAAVAGKLRLLESGSIGAAADKIVKDFLADVDSMNFLKEGLPGDERLVRGFNALFYAVGVVGSRKHASEDRLRRDLGRAFGLDSSQAGAMVAAARELLNRKNRVDGTVKGLFQAAVQQVSSHSVRKAAGQKLGAPVPKHKELGGYTPDEIRELANRSRRGDLRVRRTIGEVEDGGEDVGDEELGYETRPGTTDSQRRQAIREVGDLGPRGSVLGLGITPNKLPYSTIDLRGKKVRNSKDVAKIAQPLRNPQMEVLRFLFVKGKRVVHEEAYTLRLPNAAAAFTRDPEELAKWLKKRMAATGATQVFGLHNHPSGDPTPSEADERYNAALHSHLGDSFGGTVIINHKKYGVIPRDGKGVVKAMKTDHNYVLDPSLPHPMLGRMADSEADLVSIARELANPERVVTLVTTTPHGHIRGLFDLPLNAFKKAGENPVFLMALLRRYARISGGSKLSLVMSEDALESLRGMGLTEALKKAHDYNLIENIVAPTRAIGNSVNSRYRLGKLGRPHEAGRSVPTPSQEARKR